MSWVSPIRGMSLRIVPPAAVGAAKLNAARHFGSSRQANHRPVRLSGACWEVGTITALSLPSANQRGTNMNFDDVIISNNTTSSDFTLLEGLYQLAVTGHTDDWEFERLNNAVYERLLSSY